MTKAQPPTHRNSEWIAWALYAVVVFLAVYVWGSSLDWQFSGLSIYLFFPLLGLLAWSIMWSQYMAGLLQRTVLRGAGFDNFYRVTGYVVLVAILLHPGLLAYQRLRDGFGLPPGSETSYVGPGLAWVVVLGMVSLLVFVSFELRRWFGNRPWWSYMGILVDIAMWTIFYHSLRLGTQTHIAWFRAVWWFYGGMLLLAMVQDYGTRLLAARHTND